MKRQLSGANSLKRLAHIYRVALDQLDARDQDSFLLNQIAVLEHAASLGATLAQTESFLLGQLRLRAKNGFAGTTLDEWEAHKREREQYAREVAEGEHRQVEFRQVERD